MADIQGSYDDLFTAVPSALAGLLDDGDAGASVAVFVDGEPVVDVWGGFADADRTIPWQRDTITNVWSVTKTMTALCALILADRGDLDLAAPVGRYWPEFAAAGKEKVLVRHLLAHTAGLPDWDGPIEDLYDWPSATARLAAQAPQWEPGSAAGYHSLTQGFLVGEVVRRITGRSLGEFFAEEVAGPLGADFHIGLPAEHDPRVALTVPPPSRDEDYAASAPGSSAAPDRRHRRTGPGREQRGLASRADPCGERLRQRPLGRPRAVGHGLRRSGARGAAAVAGGLRPSEGGAVQRRGPHPGHAGPLRAGLRAVRQQPGWGGWGGSLVMIDPEGRMAVAYVTNQMREPADDTRGLELVMAAYDGLKGLRG